MLSHFLYLILFIKLIHENQVYSIPTCIIIDTDMIKHASDEPALSNNISSSSSSLKNLPVLDYQRSSHLSSNTEELLQSSHVEQKHPQPLSLIHIDYSSLKRSLGESMINRTYLPCSLRSLNEAEIQMVVPFEFRRLRVEQPDHQNKFLDDDPRETVPDLSTAVYERRSDPDGARFCRTCHDGRWSELAVCETVRCDAELLRANPRLVSEWGEIKPIDGGALYPPSTVFAIYAFAFGPHCKRCESNGQWSRYALPELCSGIKFFGHSTVTPTVTTKTRATTTTPTVTTTIGTTTKVTFTNNIIPKMKQNTTTLATDLFNRTQ